MHEITGDLFASELADAICITTNGFLTPQRANPMGRGCAGEAKRRWPGIQMVVGAALYHGGNDTRLLTNDTMTIETPGAWENHVLPYHLFMFPTKHDQCKEADLLPNYQRAPYLGREPYPGWMGKSDLKLIERSAVQLAELVDQHGFKAVVLPRPGCGAGELSWEGEVRPLLASILDDRFWVITFPPR